MQSLQADDPYKVMWLRDNDMNITNIELENITFKNRSSSSKNKDLHRIRNKNRFENSPNIRSKINDKIGWYDVSKRLSTVIKDYEQRDSSK